MGALARLSFKKETLFQFLYNLKNKFLVDCFNGGGLSGSSFFFCLWLLLLLKNVEGLIDLFPL